MKLYTNSKIGAIITLMVAMVMSVTSCTFLEFDQSTGYETAEDLYVSWNRAQLSLTNLYGYLESDFGSIDGAMRDCATDDAHYVWSQCDVHIFNDGRWSPITAVDDKWSYYYEAIRATNSFLENFAAIDYEAYQNNTDYSTWAEKAQYWEYEARFLRAYFHFELAKRYGSIPLVKDAILTVDNVNDLEVASFKEVLEYIIEECDEAADELPADFANVSGAQTGRITEGAALAFRLRALLYLASPQYNSQASEEDWQTAAYAAYQLIRKDRYSLESDVFPFSNIITSPEVILERREDTSLTFEQLNTSISFEGGYTGTCPTQNLVDAFETINGYSVVLNENGEWVTDDPNFDVTTPYLNRDARLYKTLLYDGSSWAGVTMDCYIGGKDGQPTSGASQTGYYLRKYLDESVTLAPVEKTTVHTWVLIRYADVLLMYAEAMNEAYGPTDNNGYPMTALDAFNMIRKRAGQPERSSSEASDKDTFRDMIQNERRVEFAFEDQRFWDIRRWGIGDQINQINGVSIVKDTTTDQVEYSLTTVETRTWEDKKYLYPIPVTETYVNENIIQNPGW